jgi:hypothetical protein
MGIFKRRTDEEHVNQLRRKLASWNRWQPWLKGFSLLTIGLFVGLLITVVKLAQFMLRPPFGAQGINQGLYVGLVLGLLFGAQLAYVAHHIGQFFALTWLLSFRSEKLLIRYHDELAALRKPTDECDVENSDMAD